MPNYVTKLFLESFVYKKKNFLFVEKSNRFDINSTFLFWRIMTVIFLVLILSFLPNTLSDIYVVRIEFNLLFFLIINFKFSTTMEGWWKITMINQPVSVLHIPLQASKYIFYLFIRKWFYMLSKRDMSFLYVHWTDAVKSIHPHRFQFRTTNGSRWFNAREIIFPVTLIWR